MAAQRQWIGVICADVSEGVSAHRWGWSVLCVFGDVGIMRCGSLCVC